MNGPIHDWGIRRGTDGVQYSVRGPRGGPYTSRPILTPREPGGPMPSEQEVAQAMKIHREIDKAHVVAKDTVTHINGIGAMAKMMGQMLVGHFDEITRTKECLLGHGDISDVRYAAPLCILLPQAYQLRIRLLQGLDAQLRQISALIIHFKLLQKMAEDPANPADVMGPWVDQPGDDDGGTE